MELAAQLSVVPFMQTQNIMRKVATYFAASESVVMKRRRPAMAMGMG